MSPVNRKPGEPQALQAEEVLRSLNVDVLHQSLPQFGITDISPEVGRCTEQFIKKEKKKKTRKPKQTNKKTLSTIC